MSVPMAVMKVRKMRVLVSHWRVSVPVGVRLADGFARLVGVLVVLVVDMAMFVIQRLVAVFMLVAFREVEIDADRHQDRRTDKLNGDRLAE